VTTSAELNDSSDVVEITQVEILPGDENKAEYLSSNQPVKINIHYLAYKSLGKVNASAFIIRSDGLTCCMMRTQLENFELIVTHGSGVISLLIDPLQLVSGTYFIEAWILNESDSMTLNSVAGRSDWFTVKGAALSYEETSGIYEPRAQWVHEKTNVSNVVDIQQRAPLTQLSPYEKTNPSRAGNN